MPARRFRRGLARRLRSLARVIDGGDPESPPGRADTRAPVIDVAEAPKDWVDRIRDAGLLAPGAAGRWHRGTGPPTSAPAVGARTPVRHPPPTGGGVSVSPKRRAPAAAAGTTPQPLDQKLRDPAAIQPRPQRLFLRGEHFSPIADGPSPLVARGVTATSPAQAPGDARAAPAAPATRPTRQHTEPPDERADAGPPVQPFRGVRETLPSSAVRLRPPRRRDTRSVPGPTPAEPSSRAGTHQDARLPESERPPVPAPWPELPDSVRARDREADVARIEGELSRRARWTAERNAV